MPYPIENRMSALTILTSFSRNDPFGTGMRIDIFQVICMIRLQIRITAVEKIGLYEIYCCLQCDFAFLPIPHCLTTVSRHIRLNLFFDWN